MNAPVITQALIGRLLYDLSETDRHGGPDAALSAEENWDRGHNAALQDVEHWLRGFIAGRETAQAAGVAQ